MACPLFFLENVRGNKNKLIWKKYGQPTEKIVNSVELYHIMEIIISFIISLSGCRIKHLQFLPPIIFCCCHKRKQDLCLSMLLWNKKNRLDPYFRSAVFIMENENCSVQV